MTPKDVVLSPWIAEPGLVLRSSSPAVIIEHGSTQLSTRDRKAIADAFQTENFEMAATFIWTKAAAVLKKQIASLGMEFVGEMLRRPDLNDDSDPSISLSDHDAISLAEDLGLITSTQGLRLSHALELVGHFTRLSMDDSEEEAMSYEEAISLLKSCVISILSRPNFEGADKFRAFRSQLSSSTLQDNDFESLSSSPYFFVRTTLSILLSLIKTEKGAALEHAIGNASSAVPKIWSLLRKPEKWQIGQAYAEVTSDGKRSASNGLKATLIKVHGFDYVPESLRSNSFTEAAARVLNAHYSWNNFYNEGEPMEILANMGTAIPKPAFSKCMEASLAVWLGNQWGNAFGAESHADTLFRGLRAEQWDYYINECLSSDRTILDKLCLERRPVKRWCALAKTYEFSTRPVRTKAIKKLMDATVADNLEAVIKAANVVRERILD